MKTVLYIILLLAELAGGFFMLTMASGVTGWVYFGIVSAVWAALSVMLLAKLKKVARAGSKRKLKTLLALVMLIPALGAIAGIGWFVWQMSAAGLI